jgi:hypothetical protein
MPEDMIAADTDVFAGEYVLGTLDADAHAAAQKLVAENKEFAEKVKVWERRLGELHLMVEPIEPEPNLWERIKARLPDPQPAPEPQPEALESTPQAQATLDLPEFKFDWEPQAQRELQSTPEPELAAEPQEEPKAEPQPELEFAPKVGPEPVPDTAELVPSSSAEVPTSEAVQLPASEPPPMAPAEAGPAPPEPVKPRESPARLPSIIAPEPAPTAEVIATARKLRSLRRHLAGWRLLALALALGLAAVAGLVAVWRYAPERVPPALRPAELMRLAGITVESGVPPPRKPAPPESQFDE